MAEPIRLLLADDHPVVRAGLRGMLESQPDFQVVGEAANGREAVERAVALAPQVVLMDLRRPALDGVEAIRRLAGRAPGGRVLVLTTYDSDADIVPALEASEDDLAALSPEGAAELAAAIVAAGFDAGTTGDVEFR